MRVLDKTARRIDKAGARLLALAHEVNRDIDKLREIRPQGSEIGSTIGKLSVVQNQLSLCLDKLEIAYRTVAQDSDF